MTVLAAEQGGNLVIAATHLKSQVKKNMPLGKIPTDADYTKAAIFLTSDYANAVSRALTNLGVPL